MLVRALEKIGQRHIKIKENEMENLLLSQHEQEVSNFVTLAKQQLGIVRSVWSLEQLVLAKDFIQDAISSAIARRREAAVVASNT